MKLDYATPFRRQTKRWWRWAVAGVILLLLTLFFKYVVPVLAWAMIADDFPVPSDPPTTGPSTQPFVAR